MKSPLAHTPWWTTPAGLIVAMMAARGLAHEFPATMLVIGVVGICAIAIAIVFLVFVIRR